MNREEKRALAKLAQKRNKLTREEARAYAEVVYNADGIRLNGVGSNSPAKTFEEGEKARINIVSVKARRNYNRMSEPYKQFIDDSSGKEFTVHLEQSNLISFTEDPRWLFWSGDLLHMNEEYDGDSQES